MQEKPGGRNKKTSAKDHSQYRQPDYAQEDEIVYTRLLNAPPELVWEVWTEPNHIAAWWGADDFTPSYKDRPLIQGDEWNFKIVNQQKEIMHTIKYLEVNAPSLLIYQHSNEDETLRFMVRLSFEAKNDKTLLTMRSVFSKEAAATALSRQILATEDSKQTLDKLEAYLNTQINIRQQLKPLHMSRVSTYLNFNTQTEVAFVFYKSVFGGEFLGSGIQRFGELPPGADAPPLSDEDKRLVLHIELPILGGHILMGTDAPESMGFTLNFGNNVHINLEPDTRAETKKLFDALSAGGQVTMDLQDMFWGAYFGSCTDKFGVQWMFNYSEKAQ